MKIKKTRNFCDINPLFYKISFYKEVIKRNIKDLFSKEKFAKTKEKEKLANVVSNRNSNLIKKGNQTPFDSKVFC